MLRNSATETEFAPLTSPDKSPICIGTGGIVFPFAGGLKKLGFSLCFALSFNMSQEPIEDSTLPHS